MTLQTSKLSRSRNYNDAKFYFNMPRPDNVPQWTYVEQEEGYETDINDDNNRDQFEDYQDYQNYQGYQEGGESSTLGEIRGAIQQADEEVQRYKETMRQTESGDDYVPSDDEYIN